jgi:hypothetical protein
MGKDDDDGKVIPFRGGGVRKRRKKKDDADDDQAAATAAAWELRRELDASISRLTATSGRDADPLERLEAELDSARQTIVQHARLGYGVDPAHVLQLQKIEVVLERRRLFDEARQITIGAEAGAS